MVNKNTEISHTRSDNPNQPVPTFIQEAQNLYVWSNNDAPKLKSVGITNEILEELPKRIKMCSETHAEWNNYRNTKSEAEKQWQLLLLQAIKFRADLLQTMRYAFRKAPALQAPLSSISKGTGYADLIQDLSDLSVLGRNNTELLVKINFDLTLLDTAAAESRKLAESKAKAIAVKDAHFTEFKQKRNRAFWHLHALVTEIREAGQYVFRNDKDRYIGYTSTFWKNKYNKRSKPNNP